MNTRLKNKLIAICALLIACTLSSCLKDTGKEECPYGSVQLNYYAEQLNSAPQARLASGSTSLREALFCDRIKHIRYYLYKDGGLYQQGLVTSFPDQSIGSYPFIFTDLPYGSYQILLVSNSTAEALQGDCSLADNLVLTYQGCEDTEDYFSSIFSFTVDAPTQNVYEVDLLRTHGIVRYNFVNLPDNVANIEIRMENVTSEKWITGDYKTACQVTREYIPVSRLSRVSRQAFSGIVEGDYVVGTFPTPKNELSSYYLSLYRTGEEEPFFTKLISDDLALHRNQLIDITATFSHGDVHFDIKINTDWDGVIPGGETEV